MLPPLFFKAKTSSLVLTIIGSTLLFYVFGQLLSFGIAALFGIELLSILNPILGAENETEIRILTLLIQGVISVCIFIGSPYFMLRLVTQSKISDLNSSKLFTYKQAGWVFLIGMISLPAIGLSAELNRLIDFSILGPDISKTILEKERELATLTKFLVSAKTLPEFLLLFFVVSVIAAVGEELFFRGIIQNILLKTSQNPHVAIWGTAFLFGFIHFQFQTMIPRVLLGALFGYVYFWSGNLYLAIAGHFINNFVEAVGMVVAPQMGLPIETLDKTPLIASLASVVVASFAIFLFKKQLDETKLPA
jgi:membrane protease YdiL (CAAX protease family)